MKDSRIFIRVTEEEKSILKHRAKTYGDGTISGFIRYCIENVNFKSKKPLPSVNNDKGSKQRKSNN